ADAVLAKLFAVEPRGTTQLRGAAADRLVCFRTTSPQSYANGYVGLGTHAQAHLCVWNVAVTGVVRGHGRGSRGTRLVARPIKAAARLGVEYALCDAARNDARNIKGYALWPQVGCYGTLSALSAGARAALPASLASASTTLDLQRTAAGRAWWTAHGETISMRF